MVIIKYIRLQPYWQEILLNIKNLAVEWLESMLEGLYAEPDENCLEIVQTKD
jgi:hypothetical protein